MFVRSLKALTAAKVTAKSVLVGTVAALSLVTPSAVLAQADPVQDSFPGAIGTYAADGEGAALWVVRDEDSTVYLFGTFHLLKPDVAWRSAQIDRAFASADEYWFEVADLKDMSEAISIIRAKAMSPDRPLSSLLTADEMADLDAAARSLNMSVAELDPMRPWRANLTLAIAVISQAGFKPENGVDKILHAWAETRGKPIKGFETMGQQIGFFADMDEADQLVALRSSLKEFAAGAELLDSMVTAWSTGDVEALGRITGDEVRRDAPGMYETLFTKRNQNWAQEVETVLAGSGIQFMAVGAGHLAGPESLQIQLERRGIRAERVSP